MLIFSVFMIVIGPLDLTKGYKKTPEYKLTNALTSNLHRGLPYDQGLLFILFKDELPIVTRKSKLRNKWIETDYMPVNDSSFVQLWHPELEITADPSFGEFACLASITYLEEVLSPRNVLDPDFTRDLPEMRNPNFGAFFLFSPGEQFEKTFQGSLLYRTLLKAEGNGGYSVWRGQKNKIRTSTRINDGIESGEPEDRASEWLDDQADNF